MNIAKYYSENGGGVALPFCACYYKLLYTYEKDKVLEHLQRTKSCPVCNVSTERRTVPHRGFFYRRIYTIRPMPFDDPTFNQWQSGYFDQDGNCQCPFYIDNGAGAGL